MLSPEARAAAHRLIAILVALIEALVASNQARPFLTRLAARALAFQIGLLKDHLARLAAAPAEPAPGRNAALTEPAEPPLTLSAEPAVPADLLAAHHASPSRAPTAPPVTRHAAPTTLRARAAAPPRRRKSTLRGPRPVTA